jgi:hypothetical protein
MVEAFETIASIWVAMIFVYGPIAGALISSIPCRGSSARTSIARALKIQAQMLKAQVKARVANRDRPPTITVIAAEAPWAF